MVKYCYLVSEGPQDIEFLISLLKSHGLKRIKNLSELDPFWMPLVPRTFPVDDDLMKRVPVPTFLQNSDLSIALHSAVGITRLSNTIEESLALVPVSKIFSIGIVLDADDQSSQSRFSELSDQLSKLQLTVPTNPGEVNLGSPRCGVFIIPNNFDPGTLENILIECARINYPDLLHLSENYISSIDRRQLLSQDLRELKKPSGQDKAIVSSITSILKPGRTLQVSLQDNRWINENTMQLESIRLIKEFLDTLIGCA